MRKSEFDTRLIIYRSRQVSLLLLVLGAIIGFAIMIVQGLDKGLEWWQLAPPLVVIGSLFCLYPVTEEWEYKPWQGKPRKVEQNFDR